MGVVNSQWHEGNETQHHSSDVLRLLGGSSYLIDGAGHTGDRESVTRKLTQDLGKTGPTGFPGQPSWPRSSHERACPGFSNWLFSCCLSLAVDARWHKGFWKTPGELVHGGVDAGTEGFITDAALQREGLKSTMT